MSFRRKRIIVAHGSYDFNMSLSCVLKRMGFNVIPAENGVEVLKLIKLIEPDLIMLGIDMPTMDGIETLRRLRDDRKLTHVPIIMIASGPEAKTCKTLDCSGYLLKPIKIETLHEVLQDHIYRPHGWLRENLRVSCNKKVLLKYDGNEYRLFAESISTKGIYLRKKDPFPVGSRVEITIPINDTPVHLKGNIIYIKGLFGDIFNLSPGMAIEFVGSESGEMLLINNYVKQLLAGDIIESQEEPIIELD